MKKNNQQSDEVNNIFDRILDCYDEDELEEISDLVDELASVDKITASQYMFLLDNLDCRLSFIVSRDLH